MRISTYLFALIVLFISCRLTYAQGEIQNPTFPFWKTLGNSATNPTNNFLGTIDAQDLVIRTTNQERIRVLAAGNVGIGTTLPNVRLDVNGDFALREGTVMNLANGANGTVLPGVSSHVRVTGPTTAFSIAGFAGGVNGKILNVINTTSQTLTLLHNAALIPVNGILTNSGTPIQLSGQFGSATFIYNNTLSRWVVVSTTGEIEANEWHITGNSATNDPAAPSIYGTSTIAANENWIGTTDANDFVVGTNNIERMRVLQTSGNVGIGSAAPPNLLTLNTNNTTAATVTTYSLALQRFNSTDLTLGSDVSYAYVQSWNAKPLQLNALSNFVGINMSSTAPIQNLDINGRLNVRSGVIQRGTTQINATLDLGLYSQVAANWIRIAANAAPVKFFTDQGGANGAGTNATMSVDNQNGGGVMIAAETGGTGNAGSPYQRAALEISSATKGFLMPRLTTTQRDAMGNNLAEGLMIYNIDNNCFEWWDTKSTPNGGNGFWNSVCKTCDNIVIISTNQVGYNLNAAVGGGKAENYCVYINTGVTLQANGNGGGSGAAGNPGFNATTMPSGAKITLWNYGTILAGGGNGGVGARESDGVCQSDQSAGTGGAGGHAIQTVNGVPVTVFNYGLIRAGGGGGGGAGAGCCSAGGGGGGGAGTPPGSGGVGNCYNCTAGFVCGCGGRTGCSANGNAGTATIAGTGGGGAGSSSSACSGNSNGGTGATGGVNGVAGNSEGTGCCVTGCSGASGGAAGLALQGNGSGSSITNVSGTVTGSVNP